ncbi:MAG: hypothetical protein PWQ82_714 [Thermosediminibacterales bacterium]|nr:hypothetical protein [Thermosediminibacterales bacterium]MDK2836632.1 hypothetical protein [Thermosediminibacterales bacterium]
MKMKFNYESITDLLDEINSAGFELPVSYDLKILEQPVHLGGKTIPNALSIHPMEGCDGTKDGKPDKLTYRRYERMARGGAGLIWIEATAIVPEGRANPRQLFLCRQNVEAFSRLYDLIISTSQEEFGSDYRPYTVLQLTHSGRYSKPEGKPAPIIAAENPYLDKSSLHYRIITDDELKQLEDRFVEAAVLAQKIGFDAVDIKSCHRYLISELLSAHTRNGEYGGSFENRTRFLLNIVDKIKTRLGDSIDIAVRLNAYDAIPYPYGWGVDAEDDSKPDLAEPIKLVELLKEKGVKLINITCGNPYYNPHIGRPFDTGGYSSPEHPLMGVLRLLQTARDIQKSVPEVSIIATGFSWLREFAALIAAGGIEAGWFRIAGFGRQAFAYPDFPKDILLHGAMERRKCCIACSKCTEIMRRGGTTGCVIRDRGVYAPIYKSITT